MDLDNVTRKPFKKLYKWMAAIVVSTALLSGAVLYDLSLMGDRQEWSKLDQFRARSYGLVGSWIGIAVPPVGPLKFVSVFAPFSFHFLMSSLPEKPEFSKLRSILENDEFCTRISKFKGEAIKGGNRTKHIIQRVYFSKWPIKLFDDIAVFLCPSSYKLEQSTA